MFTSFSVSVSSRTFYSFRRKILRADPWQPAGELFKTFLTNEFNTYTHMYNV